MGVTRDRLIRGLGAVGVAAALAFGVIPAMAAGIEVTPVDPQPGDDQLQPGLAVSYVADYFRDVAEMMGMEGTPGPDLVNIDNLPQRNRPVLTSEKSMGVGAFIRGLIKLDQPGTWTFLVNSNDGVQMAIGGQHVFADPGVHSDTMSPPILVEVTEPGWHQLDIDYFQRKGTAALQLFWMRPDGSAEEIVPAEAFAHLAE
jgi:hypothetical protein